MFCPNCGRKIENETAKFCPKCGHSLSEARQSEAKFADKSNNGPIQSQASPPQKRGPVAAKIVGIIFVAIVLTIIVVVFLLRTSSKQSQHSAISSSSQVQSEPLTSESPMALPTPSPKAACTPIPTPKPTQSPTPSPIPTFAPQVTPATEESEYILPHSDTEPITIDQLQGLSAEEARIARNEILARHGRRFNDQQLQEYFDGCSWYSGTIDADSFDYNVLSPLEQQNVEVIKQYEASLVG